ncbi:SPOR domain-containing protein [Fundidesulfovibrio terrae]|uniref:SPOR domain-containing protein n=1 Tax=Fundidesulfovibrio terrae TaxID=2922866 RepID=UPI001FAF28BA|nr:SPOR domain-containing protein [Fundidesulfovibrio terrae]
MWIRILAALLAALLAASCASHAPRGPGGTQRPYTIKGKTYRPLPSGEGYREEGLASWYEPGWFSGKTTANGERLRSGELTCAHKVLPMNTMLRVTNLENGREVTVRVNDRGPFVAGRCVDLTPAGARELGFYGKGSARVCLATEGDVPGMRGGQLPGPFYVQVGAFAVRENADRLSQRMLRKGYARTRVQEGSQTGQVLWRVQAGTFASMDEAHAEQERLSVEFPDAFVLAQ